MIPQDEPYVVKVVYKDGEVIRSVHKGVTQAAAYIVGAAKSIGLDAVYLMPLRKEHEQQ